MYVNPNEIEQVHIVGYSVSNFMRIKLAAVALDTESGVLRIQGRNAQGKSSFVAGWEAALLGADHTPKDAVREGADRAEVVVTLSDGRDLTLIINMTIDRAGTRKLTIRTADGTVQPRAQELLDALFNKFCFDPFEFASLPDAKRCDRVMGAIDLGFDPAWWKDEHDRIFAERRDANRDAGQLEAAFKQATLALTGTSDPAEQAASLAELDSLPEQETDLAELSRLQQAALAEHRQHDGLKAEADGVWAKADQLSARAEQLSAEIERLRGELATCEQQRAELLPEANALSQRVAESVEKLPDLDEIGQRISGVDELNRKIRAANEYRALHARVLAANNEALALDQQLSQHRELKRQALESARLPVAGLRFELVNAGESNEKLRLLLNGHPFDNASSAQQLIASVEIGMALSGKGRDMIVREGSLCDADSHRALVELARKHGIRIWKEEVSDGSASDEDGIIVIEDGVIVEHAQGAVA